MSEPRRAESAMTQNPIPGTMAAGPPAGSIPERTAVVLDRADLETHHEAAFGWALHCCRFDRDEAAEVLQTAYLKALDGRARFDGLSAMRTWLFGVIRVTAAERRRARLLRGELLRRWVLARPAGPDSDAADAEERTRLRAALGRLSARQRDVLHLVFYQDLTVDEAAGVLGISPGSARTHYARGKSRLRTLLEAGEGER